LGTRGVWGLGVRASTLRLSTPTHHAMEVVAGRQTGDAGVGTAEGRCTHAGPPRLHRAFHDFSTVKLRKSPLTRAPKRSSCSFRTQMPAAEQPVYTGERKNGRMEGYGTYRFPSGTVYTGEFLDGEFHGEGTLQFAEAGKYHAVWERGVAVKGRYVFADGLAYTEPKDGQCALAGSHRLCLRLSLSHLTSCASFPSRRGLLP